jgi:hypothetical protein
MARHISTISGIVRNVCGHRKIRNVVAGVCADALRTLDLAREYLTGLVERLRSARPAQSRHPALPAFACATLKPERTFGAQARSKRMPGTPRVSRPAWGF